MTMDRRIKKHLKKMEFAEDFLQPALTAIKYIESNMPYEKIEIPGGKKISAMAIVTCLDLKIFISKSY